MTRRSHAAGMAPTVKTDVRPNPIDIGLLGPYAVVQVANAFAQPRYGDSNVARKPSQARTFMTPLTQQVLEIVRQRLSARHAALQAEIRSAAQTLTAQLQRIDVEWARVEQKQASMIEESPSQAWTDSLTKLHAQREMKYAETRADLTRRLSLLGDDFRGHSFDEVAVEQAVSAIEAEIAAYATTLAVKRRQNELRGEYGDLDNTRWLQEATKFVARNPAVSSAVVVLQQLDSTLGLGVDWVEFVVSVVDRDISPAADLPRVGAADGIGFEHACAAILEDCGWVVTVTRATGDQGVDLLAKRNGLTVAIQCKNTAQPVGNSAVQEVFAGKSFYEATGAVVVSRAGFTPSAVQLAHRLVVTLVDATALADLDRHLK